MSDPSPSLLSSSQSEIPKSLIIEATCWGVFIVGLIWLAHQQETSAICILSIPLSYMIGVCWHELAHAVAGNMTGGEVSHINLGLTPHPKGPHLRLKFLWFNWKFYATPFAGSVRVHYFTERHYRLRFCLMVAAGPLANLFAALAVIPLLKNSVDPLSFNFALGWFLANFSLFASSALPRKYGKLPRSSDGQLILTICGYSDEQIQANVLRCRIDRDYNHDKEKLSSLSLAELMELYEGAPENLSCFIFLLNKLIEEHHASSPAYLLKLAEHPHIPREVKAGYLDSHLTNCVIQGTTTALPLSDELSLRLLQMNDTLSTQGTRGSILIDMGRYQEGKEILEKILRETHSDLDRLFSHAFLAVAASHQGNVELVQTHTKAAEHIDSNHKVLKRIPQMPLDLPV